MAMMMITVLRCLFCPCTLVYLFADVVAYALLRTEAGGHTGLAAAESAGGLQANKALEHLTGLLSPC